MRPLLPVLIVALSTLLLTSAWAQAPAQATLTAQAGSLIAWRSLTDSKRNAAASCRSFSLARLCSSMTDSTVSNF